MSPGRHSNEVASDRVRVLWFAGACLAAMAVLILITVVALNKVMPAPVPAVSAAPAPPKDLTVTPQAEAFLAKIYRDDIGPPLMDAPSAVDEAVLICIRNKGPNKVSLPTLAQRVHDRFKKAGMTPLQAAAFVDDARNYYCPGG